MRTKYYTIILFLLVGVFFIGILSVNVSAQTTTLKVNITPQGAIDDGAMWRYKDKDIPGAPWLPWQTSGVPVEIYSGTFIVNFKNTTSGNWITPGNREVTVDEGEHKVINQTYQSASSDASLIVNLNTNSHQASVSNASWGLFYYRSSLGIKTKIVLVSGLKSGAKYTFKPLNNPYYIEYSFVKDLARPYTESISINPGENIEITRKYKDLIVGNVHIFGNKLEYGNNEFGTFGNTQWAFKYNSGTESVKYVKCKADLKGTFSPALIKGRGTLHANEDLGILDKMLTFVSDKRFYNGKFLLNANTLEAIETSQQKPIWEFGSMIPALRSTGSFTVEDFKIIKSPVFGLVQSGIGLLDQPIFKEASVFRLKEFKVFQDNDKPQITGKVIWEGAEVENFFKIHQTKVDIDTTSNTFKAEGFDVEITASEYPFPDFRGDIKIVDGALTKLKAELYGIGKKVDDFPIIFDNCGFSFENPKKKSTTVEISAGVKFVVPGTSINAGSESWEGTLDLNGHLKVSGKREIFGYEIGNTETEIQWRGNSQYVSSFIDASYYVSGYFQFLIEGQGSLYLQWKPSFSLNGWIMASGWVPLPDWLATILPGWLLENVDDGRINLASFMVNIDPDDMYISITLLKLFTFRIDIPPFWDKNSGSPETFSIAQNDLNNAFTSKTLSTGSVENFVVNHGEPGFILSLQGNAGAPDAVLVKPDGTKIDPKTFISNDESIIVSTNDEHSVTGFIVTGPQPGIWHVELTNSAGVTQRLIRGNHPPRILPVKLEKEINGGYKLTYNAFDADNNAEITFYLSQNNNNFQGEKIGTAIEKDGTGTFFWDPDGSITAGGYIYAVINDGINPPQQAYFKGRTISPNAPSAPLLSGVYMSGDNLILTFDNTDFSGIDSLKIYYSDDLETENLTKSFVAFPRTHLELSNISMPPGRKYQLRVTTYSAAYGESDFSARFDIDYRLVTGNNYPQIISKPVLRARSILKTDSHDIYDNQHIKSYNYQIKAQDYDNDHIYYSIIRGPKQLHISENGHIYGEFSNNEVGSKSVVVQADDGNGGTDIQKFRINLAPGIQYNTMSISRSSNNDHFIISLRDVASNYNSTIIDTFKAVLQDLSTGIEWTVTLRETSVDSGKFQGLIKLNGAPIYINKSGNEGFQLSWENKKGENKIFKTQ